jgi:tartrate dehydratase beta subunit/fumarate hydratase class I family protein
MITSADAGLNGHTVPRDVDVALPSIGPAGPTTAGRMGTLTLPLLERGLRGMVAKGYRSSEVRAALSYYGAVYLHPPLVVWAGVSTGATT